MASVNANSRLFPRRDKPPTLEVMVSARRSESTPVRDGNARILNAVQALDAMSTGSVVHRIGPDGKGAKYHRISRCGDVEAAESDTKMLADEWVRASTDIASWYSSTFRVVVLRREIVTIGYEQV